MAVRRVPGDHPDFQSAIAASAPGDRIEATGDMSLLPSRFSVVVTVDGLAIDYEFSMVGGAGFSLGPGVRSLALPGSGTFVVTGNDLENSIVGGPGSGSLSGLGGDDLLVGGPAADRMEGGTGNDTYEVDNTANGPVGSRIPPFIGDQAVERLDEGWDAVWASVDFTLPAHVEGLVLTGGARRGVGNEAGNLIVGNAEANFLAGLGGDDELRGGAGDDTYLVGGRGDRVVEEGTRFGPGFAGTDQVLATVDYELPAAVENLTLLEGTAAVWGVGNDRDNRITGNERDNRLVGWDGNDTLTGGAGDDLFVLLGRSFMTITDFWPGAGSEDRLVFPRDLFPTPEEALAAARQPGTDVLFLLDGRGGVTLQNTRLADLTPDDIAIV